jgi:cytochrome c oxidase subunit I+III
METGLERRQSPIRLHKDLMEIWATRPGFGRLSAVNHTTVGLRFIITSFVFFAIGGGLAMLIRAQIATSGSAFADADTYAQFFTMHGTVMMFLFAIPMLEGFAIYMLPKQLGARDLAFPRLTAFGYWCYLFGGTIIIVAMFAGVAPDSGWFMYTPLSSRVHSPGINSDIWLLGITFVEISAMCAAVEIVVTILKMRAPGMSLDRMPILAWYLLVTMGMIVVGFPPLILASVLLEMERAFDLPFFDPARGGDPLLWQHLFWLFGHPEVYIIFLPAAGAISTILPVFARHELVGYRAIVVAIIALAFLSFGIWVHHMYTVGIPHMALAFFSAASGLVAIPTGVQIFAWIATIAQGRLRWDIPMLYLLGFFIVFVMGGMTGVMLALVPFNWQAHDTHFVVAHLHYVLFGGFVFPMLAAAYYWLPLVTGKATNQRLGVPAFWLIFIGFHLTFFMMHLTGLRGMPRRVHTYPAEYGLDLLNLISSVGGFIMTIGFALFVIDMVLHIRYGRPFRRNEWKAATLEWALPKPPPAYAFASLPTVEDRADRLHPGSIGNDLAAGRGYLGFVRHGWMETLGVDMVRGRITEVIVLPRPSYLPFWTALAIAGFVLSFLFSEYGFAAFFAGTVLVLFLLWTRGMGAREDYGEIDVGRGERALPHWETERPPSWWAMLFTLTGNSAFYASLVFGLFFLWVSAPNWPPPQLIDIGLAVPAMIASALALAFAAAAWAVRTTRRGGYPVIWLLITLVGHAVALAGLAYLGFAIPGHTAHAHSATGLVVILYLVLHTGLGVVFAGFGIYRTLAGYVSARRLVDLRIGLLWHAYTFAAGVVGLGAIYTVTWLAQGRPTMPW